VSCALATDFNCALDRLARALCARALGQAGARPSAPSHLTLTECEVHLALRALSSMSDASATGDCRTRGQ
jgi:hypothetical protein